MTSPTVLLITDDREIERWILEANSAVPRCSVERVSFRSAQAALKRWPKLPVLLVHASTDRQVALATSLVERFGNHSDSTTAVIVLTEQDDAQLALRLLRLGAVDVLSRPFDSRRLYYLIDLLTVQARYESPAKTSAASDYVASSQASRELVEQAEAIADLSSTVLITGETGTGKSHLAQLLHQRSMRSKQPFVIVNCGGLSSTLLESELFGHAKGAFTGAHQDFAGRFAQAGDGTLLLEEIEAMPVAQQASLLRVVEDGLFEPVGSNRSRRFEARLVVATNSSLEEEVAARRFRADLFYRINVFRLQIPPLRDHTDDIGPLAESFLQQLAAKHGMATAELTASATAALESYAWPGNIRELRNVMERALVVRSGGQIDGNDIRKLLCLTAPGLPARRGTKGTLAETKRSAERRRILLELEKHSHNRTSAARALGISRTALYKKLRQHGI